ncbi:MAG TPA: sulfotransferase [Gaiellaceae bacterium]|nr:sulfotransferase [Gaiellaceae bacterium]
MEAARRRARRQRLLWRKRAYRMLNQATASEQQVVLILGCQRSGTSMILSLFDEDLRAVTFPERSVLTLPDEDGLRLRPLPEVAGHVRRLPASLVVLKPLVESQRAPQLLSALPNARAIWMYRGYGSVAASNLAYFGRDNGVRDLRLLLSNDPPNWRGEVVPGAVREVIAGLYSPGMNPYDAAALFWFARNSLFFDLRLDESADVLLCSYEELVASPEREMTSIYEFLELDAPQRPIGKRVHGRAVERGDDGLLSSEVRTLCAALHARLRSARRS